MDALDIIDHHLFIRQTVGYEVLSQVPIEDMPKVMEFLKIVYNYNRMKLVERNTLDTEDIVKKLQAVDREIKEREEKMADAILKHIVK
mgnify:FL=1